ncbi:MAG: hypothetical protein JOY51_07745, partial [Nevskia sp.]|nr:hypothetical protein [Nevskia sp.]
AGPNFGYQFWTFGPPSPYPSYLPQLLTGQVGVLPTPADAGFAAMEPVVDASLIPGDGSGAVVAAPAGSPVVGADGGPSQQIKYVFYLVRENRTYDQIFGTHANANGDPALELFDDNGATGPGAAGVTPNAHTLADRYVLLDNFYEDSEVSVDGHIITGSGYANDYVNKSIHGNYSSRGRPYDFGIWPVTFPPQGFLFDQAVRQGVSFRNYGEGAAGVLVSSPDRTASGNNVYAQVVANTLAAYPTDAQIGCETSAVGVPNSPQCVFDAGMGTAPPLALSRIDIFNADFAPRARAGTVPALNYLVMTNDHTHGYKVGDRDPLAMVADNDLGLGQLVQIISSYPAIWAQSVIFVVEDDSQDGQDHVDAHRAPALVIGPWVKRGAIVHTHYDQYSVLRTIELILGLKPLSLHDANALPMYDLFIDTGSPGADTYTAVTPTQNIQAVLSSSSSGGSSSGSSSGAAAASSLAAFSAALPWQQRDAVPQELSDRVLWQRVHGADSTPPPPGPNASPLEHQRAVRMMEAYRRGELAKLRELAQQAQDHD